ncbi:MAG: hypothetical protein VX278_21605, partial [Myxococcota bacterium]|nr:hypothetical protein [Myxococcota bacterium]
MTPTQHILSTVVLLTLSACEESNPSSEEGSSSTATETVKAVENQPTEAEPPTTKSLAETDPVAPPEPQKEPETVTQTLVKTKTSVQTQTKKTVKKKKTPSELDPAKFLSTRLEKDILETGFVIQGSESSTRYPGRYCINVGEGASCPTVSDMRKRMPDIQGCSPYKYVEITSEAVRQDLRIFHVPYPPPNPPEAGDACCYQAEYVRVRAPCVYGRPLMHKGEAQLAQSVEREDWN